MVTARFLYKEEFDFKPQFKLWMATNNKPEVSEDTIAIWSRIKLIPFTVTFTGDKADKHLSEKLSAVKPSIFSWAVRGCLAWLRDGLVEPDAVKQATNDYRDEQDVISDFLLEKCSRDVRFDVKAKELYQAYQNWCASSGLRPVSETSFGSKITNHGIVKHRTMRGMVYEGIRLRTFAEIAQIEREAEEAKSRLV